MSGFQFAWMVQHLSFWPFLHLVGCNSNWLSKRPWHFTEDINWSKIKRNSSFFIRCRHKCLPFVEVSVCLNIHRQSHASSCEHNANPGSVKLICWKPCCQISGHLLDWSQVWISITWELQDCKFVHSEATQAWESTRFVRSNDIFETLIIN